MAKFFTPTKISENIRETPEGYLLCLGVAIARTGWQEYAEGETPLEVGEDGVVWVYRDPKDVFSPKTIASFQGKPATIRHPEDFVNPDNWQMLSRGILQNVRKGEEKDEDGEEQLVADILITEATAIALVKNGLREVSCGYDAEYEQVAPGEGRQFNIVGNHIALVEQGRAGPSYAINDHKGKKPMDKLIEKLKAKFGAKAVDEAMKEDKKDEPAKDAGAYDELMKMFKDMSSKVDAMCDAMKPKDEDKPKEDKPKDEDKPKEDKPKDEGSSLEDRLAALEVAVKKLLEAKAGDEEEEEEEAEGEDEEESEDDDFEESELTGDTKARVEILAPGLKAAKGADAKKLALEKAYESKDGKEVLELLSSGKKPTFDSAEKIDSLFMAASEILKNQRGTGLERTKNPKAFKTDDNASEVMTPEKLNEVNAAHWAKK